MAQSIVHGFLIGQHKGTRRGVGSEFSQYRSYQAGDDIRQIDWKMFVRSDRYYIKEAETETSITVRLFLDGSASMNVEENGVSRFNYASLLTASLATLAVQQGDAVALHIVNSHQKISLREKRGKQQLNRIFSTIESWENTTGTWPSDMSWLPPILSSHQKELWIVCSDFLDDLNQWKAFSKMATTLGNEVECIQILSSVEKNLAIPEYATLKDVLSTNQKNINVSSVKETYSKNLEAYLNELRSTLTDRNSSLYEIVMNQPLGEALFALLKQRTSR